MSAVAGGDPEPEGQKKERMTMKVTGIFTATGTAITLCLGLIPKKLSLTNLVTGAKLIWDAGMNRSATLPGGLLTNRASASSVKAGLTTAMTGSENDITLVAKTGGTAGNAITLALVDPAGNNASLGIVVTGNAIVANLATGSGGAISTTAALLVAAINNSAEAFALVAAYVAPANAGSGLVTALAATALTGGLDGQLVTLLTAGNGVASYSGGARVATEAASVLMPLSNFDKNNGDLAGDLRTRGTGLADGWTLGSAGNRTGSFNAGVATALVGPGSPVIIGGKTYNIVALTNDGDAANEVTLNAAAPSGKVEFIGYKNDWAGALPGTVLSDGITLAVVSGLNVATNQVYVEAEL